MQIAKNFTNNKNDLTHARKMRRNAISNKKIDVEYFYGMSGVNSQARSFYGRSAAEPLTDARGTLGFRGTPVENHCSKDYT